MRVLRRVEGLRRNEEAGSALVLSLASVGIVALLATTFLQYVSTISSRQAAAVDRKKAFYLAEAGLAEGFAGIVCGRSGVVGSEASPAVMGDGLFWVEAEDVSDTQVQLTSVGMSGRARAQLSAVVQKGTHTLLDMGFFSNGDMTVEPGVRIDSYDSSKGAYLDTQTGRARLVSNQAVTLTGTPELPTSVDGDVLSGPAHSIDVTGEVTVTGDRLSSPEPVVVPEFKTPRVKYVDPVVVDSPFPYVAPPSVIGLRGLTIAPDSEVVLQGPSIIVIDDLLVQNGGALTFDGTGGPIFLYVTNTLDLQAGSRVETVVSDPTRNLLFVNQETEGVGSLRATAEFHGIVFAPKTSLNIAEAFEIFGSVGALNLLFEGPVKLHFDHMLVALAERLRRPVLQSWRIDELSTPSGVTADPFALLGVDRATLSPPVDAREDQLLDLSYLDAGGNLQTYSGLESGFDWTLADVVVRGTLDAEPLVLPSVDKYYEVANKVSETLGFGGITPIK